jgi:hypothetical protein
MTSALEALKASERLESLILIVDDAEAKRLLAAWVRYGAKFKDRAVRASDVLASPEFCKSLWSEEVDVFRLSRMAGVRYNDALDKWERLTQSRLAYPDGSISPNASGLIIQELKERIKAKRAKDVSVPRKT